MLFAGACARVLPLLLTVCAAQPRVTLCRYIQENHDLIWPWFPAHDEVLPFTIRFLCVVATLLFQLCIQTVWSTWFVNVEAVVISDLPDLLRQNAGTLLSRITVATVTTTLFSLILAPVVRVAYRSPFRQSDVRWKRVIGVSLSLLIWVCLAVLVCVLVVFSVHLMQLYSCEDLVLDQLMPFVVTVFLRSIVVGVPVVVLFYLIVASCGAGSAEPLDSSSRSAGGDVSTTATATGR